MKRIILVALMLLLPTKVWAISPADLHAAVNESVFYDQRIYTGATCDNLPPGNLPALIPEPYNGAFTNGANKHKVAPALIAALFTEENFTGTDPSKLADRWAQFPKVHPDPNSGWPTNKYGTMGAFQFIPPTWAAYGDDGNNDGKKDAQNIADGAAGAANYVAANGATVDQPPSSWQKAIFAYNHAQWYVDAVMKYYAFYNGGGNTTSTGSPTGQNGAAATDAAGNGCGGTGVSPDGFVFPQRTTKAQIDGHSPHWNPNCTNKYPEMGPGSTLPGSTTARKVDGLCHHDYLAADIFNDTGTPVLSPRPGRVLSAHTSSGAGCDSVGYTVRIFSDKALGGDGNYYYFAHMKTSAEGGKSFVTVGATVKAGDQIGVVGTDADAQCTAAHTHLDISPVMNDFSRGYDGTSGPLLDPMPALKPAYEALPAK